jgi:hypothetical protein
VDALRVRGRSKQSPLKPHLVDLANQERTRGPSRVGLGYRTLRDSLGRNEHRKVYRPETRSRFKRMTSLESRHRSSAILCAGHSMNSNTRSSNAARIARFICASRRALRFRRVFFGIPSRRCCAPSRSYMDSTPGRSGNGSKSVHACWMNSPLLLGLCRRQFTPS